MRRRSSRGSVRRVGIGVFEFEREELVRRGLIEMRERMEDCDGSINSRTRPISKDRLLLVCCVAY
jgi:hypothetical protein